MSGLRGSIHRQLIGAALVASAVGGIIYAGPSLGLTRHVSILIATSILLVCAGVFFLMQYRSWRSAQQLEAALREQGFGKGGTTHPGQKSHEELRKNFEESLGLLRESALGRGAIYKMPWFVIIGPAGSGKTTLLRESELKFPYMTKNRAELRGLHGTRDCDWWFSDKAVLLDTAGRWHADVDDRDEWLTFLNLLRKHRRRQPINGAIVAVSLDSVAFSDTSDLQKLADDVRNRVDELTRNLQSIFPVYLVFTKCDGLLGFVESFSGMTREQRKQIWGFTFPTEKSPGFDLSESFAQEFDQLHNQLGRRRLPQLMTETTRRRRRLVFRLPQEFAHVRNRLCQFVELIQSENPYQEASAIRGCYFTSGTQERTALGNLLAEMASKSGLTTEELEIPKAERKCYFVDDIFEKVIFEESELATPTRAARKRKRLIDLLMYGTAGIAASTLLWLSIQRYGRVEELTRNINQIVTRATKIDDEKFVEQVATIEDLSELKELASQHDEVRDELERLLLDTGGRSMAKRAAKQMRADLEAGGVLPAVVNGSLWERAQLLSKTRDEIEQHKKVVMQHLRADAKDARVRLVASYRKSVDDEDPSAKKKAIRRFDRLLDDYPRAGQLWDTAEDSRIKVLDKLDERLGKLRDLESDLLEDIKKGGEAMFAPSPKDLSPADVGAASFESKVTLPSTVVLRSNLTESEETMTIACLDGFAAAVESKRQELIGLSIAPSLQERRDKYSQSVCTKYLTDHPRRVQIAWSQFLDSLRPSKRLASATKLSERFGTIRTEIHTLCMRYVTAVEAATGRERDQYVHNTVGNLLSDLESHVTACEKSSGDMRRFIDALEELSRFAKIERNDRASKRWRDLRKDTNMLATLTQLEQRAIRLVMRSALEVADDSLDRHYDNVSSSYRSMQNRFPFHERAPSEVDPEQFYEFLLRLDGLCKATRRLPALFETWMEGDRPGVPRLAPGMKFSQLIHAAERLCAQFDLESRSLRVALWFVGEQHHLNLTLDLGDGQGPKSLCNFHPGDPRTRTRAVPAIFRQGDIGHLQLEISTDPRMTLSQMKRHRLHGTTHDVSGLAKSYWGLFRLCYTAEGEVNKLDPKYEPKNIKGHGYRVFPFEFDKQGNDFVVRLLVSSPEKDGEQHLLFGDADLFKLAFPPNPWP